MAIDRRQQFTKQPSEKLPVDLDFGRAIPVGSDHIVDASATAVKWPRKQPTVKTDATSEILLSDVPVIVGVSQTKLRLMVIDGLDEFEYQISVISIWDNGAELEDEIYVRVREE